MSGKKILMLVGDFTEEYEIFVFEQAMHAVGHTVHVVCPDKKAGDILKTSLHDFEGDQTYTEKLGHNYVLNKTFSEVKAAAYDAVYVAGGRGPPKESTKVVGLFCVPRDLPFTKNSTSSAWLAATYIVFFVPAG